MNKVKKFQFSKHLFDAILLNTKRMFIYGRLTKGLSLPVSLTLISSGIFTLPISLAYDFKALSYQRKGIPFCTQEFIDMDEVGPMSKMREVEPLNYNLNNFLDLKLLKLLIQDKNLVGLENELEIITENLKEPYYPMHRHIFESMLRALDAYQIYLKEFSEDEKLHKMSYKLMADHLISLPIAQFLDFFGNKIIAKGVFIIAQDVPAIPRLRK